MGRVWLWPNLLSLDAPVVAVLWQALFARCFHAGTNSVPALLLVLAVWLIYAADRTFDAWSGTGRLPRHEFYRRHWRAVLPLWLAVLAIAAGLAWTQLTRELFYRGLAILLVVVLYFAAVHLARAGRLFRWSKEAAVAILFATGASLAAWTQIHTVADVAAILLFSCLCWINCVAIEEWESASPARWPISVAAGLVGCGALLLLFLHRPVIGEAETASAIAFLLLDRARRRFSADTLRVLADVALLSPMFFLPVAGG